MTSNNIELFSYMTPLTALSSYTSEKVILSQYISLSAICYADETFNFIFDFSGDGINWDISVSQSITASTGTQLATPVKAKWTRIRLVSTSGINQTQMRVFVYGTPSNSALQAQLTGIGNFNPKVDVSADLQRTAFDEILTQNYTPKATFKWDQMGNGSLFSTLGTTRFSSPYLQGMDLRTYAGGIDTDGVVTKGNSTLRLSTNETTLNTDYMLTTRIVPYSAGLGIELLFTAAFIQPTTRTNNQRMLIGAMNVSGNLGNAILYDGFMIGYNDMNTTDTALEIAWYRGGTPVQIIPQSNWNIDPCDGSVKVQNIDPTTLNVFKISIGYLGVAGALFSIMGTNGNFYPVHRISPMNTTADTQWATSGISAGMLLRAAVTSTSKDGYIENGSMSIGICGQRSSNSFLIARANTITASTTETCILAVKNLGSGTIFMGEPNQLCYALEGLRVAVTSPNNVITTVNIYKNVTGLTGTYISTGNLNNSTSTSINETAFGAFVPFTVIPISQDATVDIALDESEEAIRNNFWSLQPEENYVITAVTSSSTTTVSASLSWHHV